MTRTTFERAADHHAAQNREARATAAASVTWEEVDQDRYWEMLEMLPPALQTGDGFLMGEPWTHRTCTRLGLVCATYRAFRDVDGRYFEASGPMTRAEFQALRLADILP